MKYRLIARLLLLSFALAILEPSSLLGQGSLRGSITSAENSYFAIMGQVARPGVFEIHSTELTLTQLVQKAGGITKQASGSIRIIRDGRAGIRTFFSESNSLNLLPNDLVVVDARGTASQSIRIIENPFAKRAQKKQTAKGIVGLQIALINLIDRPVVLKLRNHQTSLQSVVAMLQQQPLVSSSIQVLQVAPRRSIRSTTTASTLKPDSVLIFDRSRIEFDRLPAFPEPIRDMKNEAKQDDSAESRSNETATAEPAQPSIPTPLPSTEIRTPSQNVKGPPISKLPLSKEAGPEIAQPQSSVPLGLAVPQLENNTSTGAETISDNSVVQAPQKQIDIPLIAPSTSEEVVAVADQETIAKSTDKISVFWIVCIVGLAGTGCAVWILWSLVSQQIQASAPLVKKPPEEPKVNRLQVLIDKSCPLVLEDVEFPKSFEFYGRPREYQKNRVDQRHELQGPHFDVVTPEPSQEDRPTKKAKHKKTASNSLRVDSSHASANALSEDAAPKFAKPSPKSTAQQLDAQESGVLGRVLANFQQEVK